MLETWHLVSWWLLVAAEVLRCLGCVLVAVRGGELRVRGNGGRYPAIRNDLARWMRVVRVDAVYHGFAAVALSSALLVEGTAWLRASVRLSVGALSVVAIVVTLQALISTQRHAHIYRALKRGLQSVDEEREGRGAVLSG